MQMSLARANMAFYASWGLYLFRRSIYTAYQTGYCPTFGPRPNSSVGMSGGVPMQGSQDWPRSAYMAMKLRIQPFGPTYM